MDGLRRRRDSPKSQQAASEEEAAVEGALERMEKEEHVMHKTRASSTSESGGQIDDVRAQAHGKKIGSDAGLPSSPELAHPFWSPKAQAEVALQNARPRSLEEEERRLGGRDTATVPRPYGLEERARRPPEVKVDDREMEPDYSPFSQPPPTSMSELPGAELANMGEAKLFPVGQPEGNAGSDLTSGLENAVPQGLRAAVLSSPGETSGSRPLVLSDQQVLPSTGAVKEDGGVEQLGELINVQNVQSQGSRVERVAYESREVPVETELELAQMRSLVEHLVDRIERVEADKAASFGSASSGRLGWVDHQALDRELARQAQRRELEAFTQQGLDYQVPEGPPRFPSASPASSACPPLPLPTNSEVASGISGQRTQGSPQYFALSPRASAQGLTGVVSVHGVDHVWKVINGTLKLEPLDFMDFKRLRALSPPPAPPSTTPPPSPPPLLPPRLDRLGFSTEKPDHRWRGVPYESGGSVAFPGSPWQVPTS